MNLPLLTSRSRVMFFAPHPDDESLAAGIYLQRAVAAGAAVRVVYATDGEHNVWPQRLLEGKVRIREKDQRRWGARRRGEALAALQLLGIEADEVEFLGLPDQGVTDLLLAASSATLQLLARTIEGWRPTHLLLPSAADTHPDHSGLAVLLRVALEDHLSPQLVPQQLHYLVHGSSESFARAATELTGSPRELQSKRQAILCHGTQVAFSRRRFLSYAQRPERFVTGEGKVTRACDGPIRSYLRDRVELRLHVAFTIKPLREEGVPLYLLGHDPFGRLRRLRVALPGRSTKIDLVDVATGEITSVGRYQGDAYSAHIFLPLHAFAVDRPVFLKLDRRVWFFDEAGWVEIAPAVLPQALPALPRRELAVA